MSLRFKRRLVVRGKVGKFSFTIEFKFVNVVTAFLVKKSKEANCPSGGVHLGCELEVFQKYLYLNCPNHSLRRGKRLSTECGEGFFQHLA